MRIFQWASAVLLSLVCYGAAAANVEIINIDVVIINEMMNSGFSMTSMEKTMMHNMTKETELFKLCKELRKLEEIVLILANVTLLEEFEKKHNLTADQVTKLKDEAQNATMELDNLKSNATLVEECLILEAHLMLLRECRKIRELIIIIEISNNATLLIEIEEKVGKTLTADQQTQLKTLAANATTEIAVFEKNTTLITDCKTLLNITLNLNLITTATQTLTSTHASTVTSTVRLNTTTSSLRTTTTSLRTTSVMNMTTTSVKPTTTANTTTVK
jgi:hypothetical protein